MKTLYGSVLIIVLALGFVSCKDSTSAPVAGQGQGVLNGRVVDASSGAAVAGAYVYAGNQYAQTDTAGKFSFTFPVSNDTTITVQVTKDKYTASSQDVVLKSGEISTAEIRLSATTIVGGGGTGGKAQTIGFLGAAPNEISVYGVGGLETSVLGWEVRDSLGLPITDANFVQLSFSLVGGPGGGEYISPPSVRTGTNGKAYTTFNSGTRSGVAQVVASATVDGHTITTSPVRLIINGGFPVQDHFTLAATNYNFPALDWVNRTLPVSVLAGDMYGNPVAPNTAIYLTSLAGVIQPSVFTDKNGQGTVLLFSGNPYPYGAYAVNPSSPGYHHVIARTVGQGVTVIDTITVLWSGVALIDFPYTTFTVDSGASQTFNFKVSDELGHPLAAGTSIAVKATVPPPPDPNSKVNQVQLTFGIDGTITLEDFVNPGTGTTDFSFTLSDGTINITQATTVTVTISVRGPNGTDVRTIYGTVY
jgi:hypothetical protein